MKRMIPLLCALAMLLVGCVPVLAASEDRPYYPVAVEESFEGGVDDYRIRKVYQLSLSDDPANIPVQDFERNGYTFHLRLIIRGGEANEYGCLLFLREGLCRADPACEAAR